MYSRIIDDLFENVLFHVAILLLLVRLPPRMEKIVVFSTGASCVQGAVVGYVESAWGTDVS